MCKMIRGWLGCVREKENMLFGPSPLRLLPPFFLQDRSIVYGVVTAVHLPIIGGPGNFGRNGVAFVNLRVQKGYWTLNKYLGSQDLEDLPGHADVLSELGSSRDHPIAYPESVLDIEDEEEHTLYAASFEELARSHVKYDTVIWVSISLLLVLAWGIGIIMLLCLPIRRYLLQKNISSRKLYVTANEIVYKSVYGIHTFRVESIAHGKAAPVDELQVQGVTDPGVLRKVIITEASKNVQDFGKGWKSTPTGEEESPSRVRSLSEGPAIFKSPSKSWKEDGWWVQMRYYIHQIDVPKTERCRYALQMRGSPRYTSSQHRSSPRYPSTEHRGLIQGEMLLNKLEEVSKSVKKHENPAKGEREEEREMKLDERRRWTFSEQSACGLYSRRQRVKKP
ncbi:unnamed protein product [Dovyalis caffra]|uniref:DUF7642 domain-containing protein n=1 Tax=Dovyalis caffra TaxID=77055 RepID=A0AAV1S9E0_9ROSI|nr:unnamed protein product [Dovyalis caffra]